jgi:hypothetical protein
LLKDYCGQYKREIFVLISALKERVAYELINFQDNIPEVILLGRLVKRLQEDLALTEDAAKWTEESWRIALSNIPYEPNHKDIQHHIFKEIVNYLNPGDCIVINDTKVIPARN